MRSTTFLAAVFVVLWTVGRAPGAEPDASVSSGGGSYAFPKGELTLDAMNGTNTADRSDGDGADPPASSVPAGDEPAEHGEQDAEKMSISDLATKLTNPVGDLWVITNQYNVTQLQGQPFNGSRWQNNLNIQPVLPLHLTNEWNLINRPIIPLYFYSPYPELEFNPRAAIPRLVAGGALRAVGNVREVAKAIPRLVVGAAARGRAASNFGAASMAIPRLLTGGPLQSLRRFKRVMGQGTGNNVAGLGINRASGGNRSSRALGAISGGLDVDTERECGIGDITLMSLLSPQKPPKIGNGSLVWGVGPTVILPTAAPSDLGQGQYQAGPAAVGLYMDKKWVFGALAQQWWSFAEKGSGHPHTNQLALQYFIWYQFAPGWQVGTSPIATVDWTKGCNEGFTLPIGIGIQRTTRIGKLPIKVGVQYMYSLVHPDDDIGSRSNIQITVSPVLPSLIKENVF